MALLAPFVSHLNGLCFPGAHHGPEKEVSPLLAQSRQAQVTLSGTVGKGGQNRQEDVRKVQDALNHIFQSEGGTQETPLPVTGICTPATLEAIRNFQNVQFGAANRWSDGLIEPKAPTVNRINELVLENTVDTARLPSLNSFIGKAQRAIGAALANLTAALPFLHLSNRASAGVFNRVDRMRLLNRHFDLDRAPNKGRAFEDIRNVYSLMRTALFGKTDSLTGHQAGIEGTSIFVIDPAPRAKLGSSTAYAFPGGFHMPNTFNREVEGVRMDTIYICPAFDDAFGERKVRVIIHELAHFVGKPSDVSGIIDNGYGLAEDLRMKKLTPQQRIHNADTYANFALEALSGKNLTRWI